MKIVFLEKWQVHQMATKWPWILEDQKYLIRVLLVLSPKFYPRLASSMISGFRDNCGFGFLIWYNGEFENFEKKKWCYRNN